MNPYDFVRVDWTKTPERHAPVWHNRLTGNGRQRLFSGKLEVALYAETPLFVHDPRATPLDPKRPALSIRSPQGDYIIPGSSLKGLLRSVVETLGNGCFILFDGDYEARRINYNRELPRPFHHCEQLSELCIACRIFGMLRSRSVFLGKVNIGDAVGVPEKVYLYPEPFYTQPLLGAKPHHASFYLDEQREHIAGRKFYFHHSPDLKPLSSPRQVVMGGKPANRYIQPLDSESQFHFRMDFTNLEEDEFGALLYAIVLNEQMRHKIGSAKPLGLGSIALYPLNLTLVDYAQRYRTIQGNAGKTHLEGDEMWSFINEQLATFTTTHLSQLALQDLERIWLWPPDPEVDYYYPSKKSWFDTRESIGKRIADTSYVPRD